MSPAAISVFELFKIGIGPSSSHTVGPMRAARRFVDALDASATLTNVARIEVELYGSLGATGKGHGSDVAVMLGLLGELPESVDTDSVPARIATLRAEQRLSLLGRHAIDFPASAIQFLRKSLPEHPNALRFRALAADGAVLSERQYFSVGGGFVVDHGIAPQVLPSTSNPSGDANAGEADCRQRKVGAGSTASGIREAPLRADAGPRQCNAEGGPDQGPAPYPYTHAAELLALCTAQHLRISDIMLANEALWRPEAETRAGLLHIWSVMQACVQRGCSRDGILPGGMKVRRRAAELYRQLSARADTASDPLLTLDWVSLYALAVNEENAAGGRVVTAPTNGAAGIIPAVLHYYQRFVPGADDEGIVRFLLTAGAIALLYKHNASISGAEVGCQGEVGVACSMAAGALAEVMGGTPQQVENAAEIGMEHHLGLTCDPVGGLVQIPCIERNAMASVTAIQAARLALRGDGHHYVSLDRVIKTMRDTGADMKTKYKETARGGLAVNVVEC